jgi:hypothetical protein
MSVSIQDVRHALDELGKLRFGEMRVEDAMHQIVQTTHAIFDVDGAGLMLANVDHHLLNAAVSDERMRHLEELQIRHQEGPCIAAEAELALLAFTDLAALLIASMLMGEQQTELAAQLQGALNSRAIIEQAKGVLIGQQGIAAHAAYAQLRARARAERRKLAVVSAEVVRNAIRETDRFSEPDSRQTHL